MDNKRLVLLLGLGAAGFYIYNQYQKERIRKIEASAPTDVQKTLQQGGSVIDSLSNLWATIFKGGGSKPKTQTIEASEDITLDPLEPIIPTQNPYEINFP